MLQKAGGHLTKNAIFVRITLIHNPGAGDDDQPDAQALQALLKKHGHTVSYQSAHEKTWAAALDERVDAVAVAGGDGTVGNVAKKLIGRDIPVAPLPLGTANNISKTLGLTELTLDEIVSSWDAARRVTFDAGVANGPWGTRYFVEAAGVGLFACAIPVADKSRKLSTLSDADAKVAYAIGILRDRLEHSPPHRLKITLDDNALSGEYVLFEAMNMEFVGPNLHLAPDIDSDDGLLDVVLVTAAEREKLQAALAKWQNGDLHFPDLTRHRARVIELEWTGFDVHFDDEAWPPHDDRDPPSLTHVELTTEPGALSFLAASPAS